MTKRIKSIIVAVGALGALGALALGGSALATASSPATSPAPAPVEKVSATDTGPAVQQGDPTTPDTSAKHVTGAADPAGPNDTTSADKGNENAPETATEKASETGLSDGPGGHADASSTADNQQQGEH